MKTLSHRCRRAGFTLVEILVAMVIVILLLLALVTITDSTRRIWSNTTNKVSQFQDAREAYEAVTHRLAEATLNTYLDYEYATDDAAHAKAPIRYARQSELRFLTGSAASLLTTSYAANCPTHAVFFQAPLGSASSPLYSNLNRLLNTCGYFIQYGDDKALRPSFVGAPVAYRFRLMEMVESAESLYLYKYTSGTTGYTDTTWFNVPLVPTAPATSPVQVRADNIVALVILPELSAADQKAGGPNNIIYDNTSLAPNYYYDSTGKSMNTADQNLNPKNQLPPVVQVTMVAVDEPSFSRLHADGTMPNYAAGLFARATDYQKDLNQLQANLLGKSYTNGGVTYTSTSTHLPLNYRVFTTNVSIRGAKWSRLQQN